MRLGVIVEGHGEVEAAPVLLRRVANYIEPGFWLDILPPDRKKRDQLVREGDFKRAIEAMARRVGEDGRILVVLDADDDASCSRGPLLVGWAAEQRPDRLVAVVLAEREWEGWYLAALESLRGCRGLDESAEAPGQPERIRNAKGWLADRMLNGYSETLDQPAFASVVDIAKARSTDSFDKLVRDMARLMGVAAPTRPERGR